MKPLPKLATDLIKIRDRIADPSRWCQRAMRTSGGRRCIIGAATDVMVDSNDIGTRHTCVVFTALCDAAWRASGNRDAILFNDTHTHDEVMAVMNDAITTAIREGGA